MWKAMGGIKTVVGLSAFSLALAYLLADKALEKGLIQTPLTLAVMFIFLFLFVIANLVVVVIYRKTQGTTLESVPGKGISPKVGFAISAKQSVRNRSGRVLENDISQDTKVGGNVEQDVEI